MNMKNRYHHEKRTHFFLFFLLRFLFDSLVDIFPNFLELVLGLRTQMNLV